MDETTGSESLQVQLARGRRRMIRRLLAETRAVQEFDDERVTRASLGLLRIVGSALEIKQALVRQVGKRTHCHHCCTMTYSRQSVRQKYTYLHCRRCKRVKLRLPTERVNDTKIDVRVRVQCDPCGRRTGRTPEGKCVNAERHPEPRWCAPCGRRTRHHPETQQCLHEGHEQRAA